MLDARTGAKRRLGVPPEALEGKPLMRTVDESDLHFGPWNPGLESRIPSQLRHLSTLLREENVFTSLAKAEELHDLTGIAIADLVAFRPQRLTLHEVLIRVTANFS